MDHLTDEALMGRIQAGQLDASGLLYQRYKRVLFAFFYNCTGDRPGSEDLVQLTFEKMIKYRKNYRGTGTLKSWLFSIARNAVKDDWKKKEKHQSQDLEHSAYRLADDTATGEERMIKNEKTALLHQAMALLPQEKRELLALVKLNGKKYREVAEIYGLKESALKVKVFRIMNELRASVGKIRAQRNY